mmetsp:Transcript_12892/g.22280  ORF Transcript_12892/g.22280 Transcript_12892/m.22280 type:complete len:312 (-) Transcript_12892:985-1920(-)
MLLRNEIGDVAVDSLVAAESNIQSQEMLNGCVCCVLVGQLDNALLEIVEKYSPDRIIVETSGSALPAPIAWAIRRRDDMLKLDGIINVVDCLNFEGYKDTSYTAKMQAQYTDLILLNKHQLVSEDKMDRVMDDVVELNPDTPKVKTLDKGRVAAQLIFGLDSRLFLLANQSRDEAKLEKVTEKHQCLEVDLIEVMPPADWAGPTLTKAQLESFLDQLPKDCFIRVKGVVVLSDCEPPAQVVNYVRGRYDLVPLQTYSGPALQLVFMGTSEIHLHRKRIQTFCSIPDQHLLTSEPCGETHHHEHHHHDHQHH